MKWWGRLFQRNKAEEQLEKELRFHIERHANDLMADGVSRDEALRLARIEFGGTEQVKESCRDERTTRWAEDLTADARYAIRRLRANPGFTLVSALTLALGIGASTAIFSAVNPILFEPLPYPDSSRIMVIGYGRGGTGNGMQSFGTYLELAERARSFETIAAMKSWMPTMTGPSEPERLNGQMVTSGYFRSLGVAPAYGKDFQASDDRLHGPKVVIISDSLWHRRFGAGLAIVGEQIPLDDELYTVSGVMPHGFENVTGQSTEIWSLLQYDSALPPESREWGHHLKTIGRLRLGVRIEQAAYELDQIARSPIAEFARQPGSTMEEGLKVSSLHEAVTRGVRPALLSVFGAVLLVLVIACVNITNLLLSRGYQRRGEFATRAALGAGRGRLIRQQLTESLVIALIGGILGLLVAQFGVEAVRALSPADIPRIAAIRMSAVAFAFGLGVSTLVGLLVGLIPALSVSRADLNSGLRQQSRTSTGGHQAARRVLVAMEVALATVLLVSGGLLLRSVGRLLAITPGFNASHLIAMQVQTFGRRYDDDAFCNRFFDQALERVRSIPGVAAAAFTTDLPLSGDDLNLDTYRVRLQSLRDGDALRYAVSPGYFETMGISLKEGRLFDSRDLPGAPVRPVIISESFAKRMFAGESPIGKQLRFGGPPARPWDVIVGVVGGVKQGSLAATDQDAVYVTTNQWLWADGTRWLVARTKGDSAALISEIKNEIWSVDKDQPIVRVATMENVVAASEAERRFVLTLFEVFGMAALLLAAVGIYGVLSGTVTERMREIGVRSALGASRRNIFTMVFSHGAALAAIGLVLGLIGSLGAGRATETLLYGISAADPITYAAVIIVLAGVSALASFAPALRAVRIDPCSTLRAE